MGWSYRCHIEEEVPEVIDDAVDVLVLLDEPVALGVRDLADHVEGVELQPLREVAPFWVIDEELLGLLEEQLRGVVDERLVLHQRGHGEGGVDGPPELRVEVVVRRAEQRGQVVPLHRRLLDDVEIGL